MSAEHIIYFLGSMGESEMAEEVSAMHNRLEAFADGLDRDCRQVLHDRIESLESENRELHQKLEAAQWALQQIADLDPRNGSIGTAVMMAKEAMSSAGQEGG